MTSYVGLDVSLAETGVCVLGTGGDVLPQEAELLLHHLGSLLAGLFKEEVGSGRDSARSPQPG